MIGTAFPFIEMVRSYIDTHAMLPLGATVLVAASGGVDSTALLTALYDLRSVFHLRLHVVHVNHQLRPQEAARDAQFVEHLAARFGLRYTECRIDVRAQPHQAGLSPQHAAREARYAALGAIQSQVGATRIALGHIADDQAETVLMRLLRGTGPTGLAGMAPVRLPFIRPLMGLPRETIQSCLRQQGIAWVEDSSNAKRSYRRNQIRLDVMPTLRQQNPKIDRRLNELAQILSAEHDYLNDKVNIIYEDIVQSQPLDYVSLRCAPYGLLPLALQRRLLRRVLDQRLPPSAIASFHHIESLRQLLDNGRVGQRLVLPGGWLAERHHETVILWAKSRERELTGEIALSVPGQVAIPGLGWQLSATLCPEAPTDLVCTGDVAYIDASGLDFPLTIRFRQPGDQFYPLGAPGRKKLKSYFIDRKIPRAQRDQIPLVVNRHEIVWVVGYQLAEAYKIQPTTQQILHLCCVK